MNTFLKANLEHVSLNTFKEMFDLKVPVFRTSPRAKKPHFQKCDFFSDDVYPYEAIRTVSELYCTVLCSHCSIPEGIDSIFQLMTFWSSLELDAFSDNRLVNKFSLQALAFDTFSDASSLDFWLSKSKVSSAKPVGSLADLPENYQALLHKLTAFCTSKAAALASDLYKQEFKDLLFENMIKRTFILQSFEKFRLLLATDPELKDGECSFALLDLASNSFSFLGTLLVKGMRLEKALKKTVSFLSRGAFALFSTENKTISIHGLSVVKWFVSHFKNVFVSCQEDFSLTDEWVLLNINDLKLEHFRYYKNRTANIAIFSLGEVVNLLNLCKVASCDANARLAILVPKQIERFLRSVQTVQVTESIPFPKSTTANNCNGVLEVMDALWSPSDQASSFCSLAAAFDAALKAVE